MRLEKLTFLNVYVHCGQVWSDHWDCMCNDECPICHGEIEPAISFEDGELIDHVGVDWVPEGGWPKGYGSLEDIIKEFQ